MTILKGECDLQAFPVHVSINVYILDFQKLEASISVDCQAKKNKCKVCFLRNQLHKKRIEFIKC